MRVEFFTRAKGAEGDERSMIPCAWLMIFFTSGSELKQGLAHKQFDIQCAASLFVCFFFKYNNSSVFTLKFERLW